MDDGSEEGIFFISGDFGAIADGPFLVGLLVVVAGALDSSVGVL